MDTNDLLKTLKCSHQFHAICFDVWGANGSDYVSCPICRKQYKKKYKHCNPPHFVIIKESIPVNNSNKFSFLLFGFIIFVCIIISCFDKSPMNKNYNFTKVLCAIFLKYSIVSCIFHRYLR